MHASPVCTGLAIPHKNKRKLKKGLLILFVYQFWQWDYFNHISWHTIYCLMYAQYTYCFEFWLYSYLQIPCCVTCIVTNSICCVSPLLWRNVKIKVLSSWLPKHHIYSAYFKTVDSVQVTTLWLAHHFTEALK